MSYSHNRTSVLSKVLFKPVDRFGVKVIRWFVEQEQVGLLNQQFAQSHAAQLSPGELRNACVARWQVHHGHRHLYLPIEVP